ncbi:hypothetical protein J0X14_18430 [Muricauda sp. CAU 1633]|uniref:hypothetical protein n=1 Tax=Allomuricauda sp. CAU 1633 TaxID=2816036 RepID=UPI001A901D34|nr:hypothetical protein [Muricauda sp. CAU 1633]MBO0324292.1 hypothetical protein [Muricauda sp. CAU 1633]
MEIKPKSNYTKLIAIPGLITLSIVIYILLYEYSEFVLGGLDKHPSSYRDAFLNSAMWAQVIVACFTMIITGFGLLSIYEIKKQTEIQRQQMESQIYKTLISDRFVSIKRFLRSDYVQLNFQNIPQIKNNIISAHGETTKKEIAEKVLEILRENIRTYQGDHYPLMERQPVLDDIESLINEYNYITMLLLKGILSKDFATNLALKNLDLLYKNKLKPFIDLRNEIAPDKSYASHYTQYIKENFS